ncbi:MAG TPA: hypothetical protein PLY93_01110 [Turneriella sp.]|nr:hypothetical protein [Turneriella sp.]
MLDTELTENNLTEIESGKRLFVKSYGLARTTDGFLRTAIKRIMHRLKRPELTQAVEVILRELTMNAAKANFKKIFFAEKGFNSNDPETYALGMAEFRETMSEDMFATYGQKAREADLNILITLDYDENRIILEVRNNVPMSINEEKRARDKLRTAMQATDLAQLFVDNIDESEGAGLGLMLCLTTLRSSDIDPRMFSVATDFKKETVARVEFPLNKEYVPARKLWQEKMAV